MTRLNWRDALATALTGGVVALYVAHLNGADLPLLSGVRALSAAVFVVGVSICAAGSAPAVRDATGPAITAAKVLAALATTAAAIGLITGADWALAALVGLIASLWLLTTTHHALGGPRPAVSRRTPMRTS